MPVVDHVREFAPEMAETGAGAPRTTAALDCNDQTPPGTFYLGRLIETVMPMVA